MAYNSLGILALAILTLALASVPALAGCPGGQPPYVEVEGQASLSFKPDEARIRLGVETRADEAQEAAKQNADVMEKLLAALKAKLGQGGEIKTVGYRISPRSQWDPQTKERRFLGYEVKNQVVVTTRDLEAMGTLLDAGVKAGANSVDELSWSLSEPSAAQNQVLAAAFEDARAQAQVLADKAGLTLGPVLRMSTQGPGFDGPQPRLMMKAAGAEANTPMVPGSTEVTARVVCVFSLVP